MIRLYFIIFFFPFYFFIPSISYSKIITLKDCRYSWEKTFQNDSYEDNRVVIDSEKKTITHLIVLTDRVLQENKKFNKEHKQSIPETFINFPTNKINKFEYQMIDVVFDKTKNEFKTFKGKKEQDIMNIFVKEKIIEQSFNSPITGKKLTINIHCN